MIQINKLLEADSYRQSIGYDSPVSSESEKSTQKLKRLKQEKNWERMWTRLGEMYGHQLISQYGKTMPETWRTLLREFSSTDLKRGMEGLLKRDDKWPPNVIEFRDSCLKNSRSHAKNHTAYIDFSDPDHPNYEAPRIESDAMKKERESTAKTTLAEMKGMF